MGGEYETGEEKELGTEPARGGGEREKIKENKKEHVVPKSSRPLIRCERKRELGKLVFARIITPF